MQIAKELYGDDPHLMEQVWLATKNNTATLIAEFLRNGGIGMG